jgi:hypothetical protein
VARVGSGLPVTFYENEDTTELMFTNQHGYQHPARYLSSDARPLVVIDPESEDDVRRLCEAYRSVDHSIGTMPMQAALREFANPTPPKPPEPTGLGAVVEDAEGVRWVRYEPTGSTAPWVGNCVSVEWDDVPAVRILSDGVQP